MVERFRVAVIGGGFAISLQAAMACGFTPENEVDAGADVDAAAVADATPVGPLRACTADPALLGCFLFDDDTTDGSIQANVVNTATVSFEAGIAGSAAVFEADDQFTIADSSFNSSNAMTIEAWVKWREASLMPAVQLIIDKDGQFAVRIDSMGVVSCLGAGSTEAPNDPLGLGLWTHVACVFDSDRGWSILINGQTVALGVANGGLASGLSTPAEIGGNAPFVANDSHFLGTLDNLLIWNTARTEEQICETAGIDCE